MVRLLLDGGWGARTREFTTLRARLARGATVDVATVAIGGRIVKQTLESLIEGEGAHSDFRGVALGDHDQHFDFVTLQDHLGPRTTSNVEIKAALAGASRSIYYGVTRVEETPPARPPSRRTATSCSPGGPRPTRTRCWRSSPPR